MSPYWCPECGKEHKAMNDAASCCPPTAQRDASRSMESLPATRKTGVPATPPGELERLIAAVYWSYAMLIHPALKRHGSSERDNFESWLDCLAEEAGLDIAGSSVWPLDRVQQLYKDAAMNHDAGPPGMSAEAMRRLLVRCYPVIDGCGAGWLRAEFPRDIREEAVQNGAAATPQGETVEGAESDARHRTLTINTPDLFPLTVPLNDGEWTVEHGYITVSIRAIDTAIAKESKA